MIEHRLATMFQDYDPVTQQILRDVLRLEQQYIHDPLKTNSTALKEVRQRIAEIIEENCRDED